MSWYIKVGERSLCEYPMSYGDPTCGHATEASAEKAAKQCRKRFKPEVPVTVVEGTCPAYAEAMEKIDDWGI